MLRKSQRTLNSHPKRKKKPLIAFLANQLAARLAFLDAKGPFIEQDETGLNCIIFHISNLIRQDLKQFTLMQQTIQRVLKYFSTRTEDHECLRLSLTKSKVDFGM